MTATERAKKLLTNGITFAAVGKSGEYVSSKRGVAPILEKIDSEPDFFDSASVADRVVGKAAAILLEKHGATDIYGEVASRHAKAYLDDKRVNFTYDKMVDHIINRDGTDMCPMEKTVLDIDDADEGEKLIRNKIISMRKG